MRYEGLFKTAKIGKLEIKNRVIMPAIHLMYNLDGYANRRFNEFYFKRAEGGVGLVIVGGCRFDEYGGSPGMMSLETDDFIPGYKEFTDGMHSRGTKVGVQLYHAGAYAHSFANDGREALAPSAQLSKFTKEMPKEATIEQLHTIVQKWAAAALRAKKAGFDTVEISASAGYLICQFLSLQTNHRTDEYGGSWENRTRLACEVVAAIRAAVGEDYPVCIRIAGNDLVDGSNTNEDAVAFAKAMEKAGVDLINVTGGWHESVIPQLTGDQPRAGLSYLAAAVKAAVSVPVAVSNRINDPAVAEVLLATEQADFVSIGRPMIADPDWCIKAEVGREDTIRRCLSCNQGCLAKTFFASPVECIINASAGKEYENEELKTAGNPKKILVVGAGPGGCEFAIRAAQLGHSVTIWEKSDKIGGQVNIAAAPPAKEEFTNLIAYHRAMLSRLGVSLVLNKEACCDCVSKGGFDLVVTATGNIQNRIDLPGIDKISSVTADEILNGSKIAGKNVVIVGGAAVGCECADYLAHQAALSPQQVYFMLTQKSETTEKVLSMLNETCRTINIVDVSKIGTGFEQGTAWPLLKELSRFGVGQHAFAKILEITDKTVEIEAPLPKTAQQKRAERETGVVEPPVIQRHSLPCDTLVFAVGSRANSQLFDRLTAAGVKVYNLGDSVAPGKISDAIVQAAQLINEIV